MSNIRDQIWNNEIIVPEAIKKTSNWETMLLLGIVPLLTVIFINYIWPQKEQKEPKDLFVGSKVLVNNSIMGIITKIEKDNDFASVEIQKHCIISVKKNSLQKIS